ncbi:MAG: hypothetical protein KDD00_15840, partial [Ignavibacteriae bacterium]|nr:hypothetical protein [Ignavibacteriota bacterium]
MKKVLFLLFLAFRTLYSQQSIDQILDQTLSFRGLTLEDITIPVNYDKVKSPRNGAQLLLPAVKDLMQEPMKSFGFMDSVMQWRTDTLETIINKCFDNIIIDTTIKNELFFLDVITVSPNIESWLNDLVWISNNSRDASKKMFNVMSKEDKIYLNKNLLSIISESEDAGSDNSNIFKYNRDRDSSILISKKTLDILDKLDIDKITKMSLENFKSCFDYYAYRLAWMKNLKNEETEYMNNNNVVGDFIYYYDEEGIRIAIGGKGKNIYTGHFDFIIDLGGDDVYNIDRETDDLFKNNFSCIIDLSGNDYYTSKSNYSLAGAVFSSGFIFDKEGDDTYKGKNVTLGSAICGLGVLYDESGNDTYQANQFSIGAASFGVGLLVDRSGNDIYIANSYSQGFGMTEGVGAIVDNKGNDNYLIDARSLDIGRYEDHYVSMSQGYGLGLRPYYAGGIGLIIEGEGNDIYSTDIFGQGGAYWYGLGCIVDRSGNDKYNSYQYAQGAGIHLAVGLLKDYEGWDFYSSNGVSQGCGHDFGFGLLFDVKGNDNYSAYSLSQGAGNANGIGMLIDESGRDGYLNKEPGNSRGYGNSRREFGSLGIFLDASGEDFYSVGGMDSTMSNSSMWGVFDDYYLMPENTSPQSDVSAGYKVPFTEKDSIRNYTQDELFIMAKTIEPRFSRWQEFGFRKLAEDSLNTPAYIMKYLDTEDHRAGLVLRNLSLKISNSIGNYFRQQLNQYNNSMRSKPTLNPDQVAFICYLFGETRTSVGKEELLGLTYDNDIRIRTTALNALGKIIYDTLDTDYIIKVSGRLRELSSDTSVNKLYKKDISYAFKNYKNFDNIASLINLMDFDYFGVRFPAAEALKTYGDDYFGFI